MVWFSLFWFGLVEYGLKYRVAVPKNTFFGSFSAVFKSILFYVITFESKVTLICLFDVV